MLAWVTGAFVGFVAIVSNEPTLEVAGVALLVLLVAWLLVALFRARQRIIR